MASEQQERKVSDKIPEKEKKKLDERAAHGETVVPGGTGGKTLEAQENLAEGIHIYLFFTNYCYVRFLKTIDLNMCNKYLCRS